MHFYEQNPGTDIKNMHLGIAFTRNVLCWKFFLQHCVSVAMLCALENTNF